jgi:hypothetical protein
VERQLLREQEQCDRLEKKIHGYRAEAKKMAPQLARAGSPRSASKKPKAANAQVPTKTVQRADRRAAEPTKGQSKKIPEAQQKLQIILDSKNRRIMQQKHDLAIVQNSLRGEVRIHKQALAQKAHELDHTANELQLYKNKMTKLSDSVEQLQQVMATYGPVFAAHGVAEVYSELQERVFELSASVVHPHGSPRKQQQRMGESSGYEDNYFSHSPAGASPAQEQGGGNDSSSAFTSDDIASFIRAHHTHSSTGGGYSHSARESPGEDQRGSMADDSAQQYSPQFTDSSIHSPTDRTAGSARSQASSYNSLGAPLDLQQANDHGPGQREGGGTVSTAPLKAADMSSMFEYVFTICCTDGGKQTSNLSVTQFLRFANRARIVDDRISHAMVEGVFTSTVKDSQRGSKKKFSKRIAFDDFRQALVELAILKFPQHSAFPVAALTELYTHFVLPFGHRMEMLLGNTYSVAILSVTEQMSTPDVVAFFREYERPLRKIFKRYSSIMGDSLRKIQTKSTVTTLDIDSFVEFACDYAITPNLLGEAETRKVFADLANVSAGLGGVSAPPPYAGGPSHLALTYNEFLDCLGCLAVTISDESAQGVEEPSTLTKLQQLFYAMDRSGLVFGPIDISHESIPRA